RRIALRPCNWRKGVQYGSTRSRREKPTPPTFHCRRHALFALDARASNDRPPLFGFLLVECVKRVRRLLVARENLLADIGEPLAPGRAAERGDLRRIELDHNVIRRALGHP